MNWNDTTRMGLAALVLLLAMNPLAAASAREAENQADRSELASRSVSATRLAAQVREIANSAAISSAKKEKRISTAVRTAVVVATAYRTGSEEIMGIALDFATAAARAAPRYAEVIVSAISFAPPVAKIDTAANQVRNAAYAAAKGLRPVRPVELAADDKMEPAPSARRTVPPPAVGPTPRATRLAPDDAVAPSESDYAGGAASRRAAPATLTGENTVVDVTLDVSARRDSNFYLNSTNEVSTTITSVTPGVAFRFGQSSMAHGAIGYKAAFTRYQDNLSPNVTLGTGNADFGYDNGNIILSGGATSAQMNQNNSDVANLGQNTVFRHDVLSAHGNVESHLTPKTSLSAGVVFSRSDYKSGGLIGTTTTDLPLKLFHPLSPRVDLSLGYTYTRVTPQLDGPSGRNSYYNLGLRGDLSSKLKGNFSMGYRTEEVAANPAQHLLGFEGSFNYDATAKTSLALALSRDFSAGAQGETLKNSSYTLKLTSDPTPQWQLGADLTHRSVDYGPTVFSSKAVTFKGVREDLFWETSLSATYLFSSWLSTSVNFTFSDNHSTLPGAQFSDNTMTLVLGLRY